MDGGKSDEKIIAIPFADPSYNGYQDISDLPDHLFEEMSHFFSVYKALEGKNTVAGGIRDRKEASVIIEEAIRRYRDTFC